MSLRLTAKTLVLALLVGVTALAQTKLLRFPDIHGDKVVFTYGGDLWTAGTGGGVATRLTAHPGLEVFAKFSPDGKWIAFTGQYDGDEQVYVMPAAGGTPRQLTFYPAHGPLAPRWGYDNQVYGWTNDGKQILFRSMRDSWTNGSTHLYTVSMDGGPAEMLPMPESGAGDYSPDGGKIVYSPRFRDFRTEKRYNGGQANQLYIFDLETHAAKKITDQERASRDPMWIGDKIYFDSDRDGHFNLYVYDTKTAKTAQVTTSKQWDLRWPGSDRKDRIIYEMNGELQILDVKSAKSTPISITVPDDEVARRPTRVSAANLIEDFGLSPKGERVLFSARGDIFTAPVEKGPTRNLTNSSDAHDKHPRWSPDGSKIAYISDKTGEEEIWVVAQDGSSPAQQLTSGGKAMRYAPEWSSDGRKIAFSDKDGYLWVLDVDGKKLTQAAHSTRGVIQDYEWSPKGDFLAFSMNNANTFGSVYVWAGADTSLHKITDENFDCGNPAWDPQGNYLYYIGIHDFAPQISQVEYNFATNRGVGIFALALRKDVKNPFPPESDEVTISKEGEAAKEAAKTDEVKKDEAKKEEAQKTEAAAARPFTIDFDGLGSRVTRFPLEGSNYSGLSAKTGFILYSVSPAQYNGRSAETRPSLRIYSLKDRKETTLGEDIGGWMISRDGSKLLVHQAGNFSVFDATPTGANAKKPVSTAGLRVDKVPVQEWEQIFNEVWRRYRDFFYAPNMHGYDWEAVRQQYKPWLKDVASRADLNYVLSEMISELTVQHAYIEGGDMQSPARQRVALPGARFALDPKANRFRISKIFQGQNEEDIYRSPLTEVGVDAKVGDYVMAINGHDLNGSDDPYRLLRNAADNPVELLLNDKPEAQGARKVSFRPITDESKLLYLDWVQQNMKMVNDLSGGKLGYIHIPDMGADGIREFIKWFYPQIRKEGLVVDVRANGGGNVSRMIIERLRRKPLATQFQRAHDDPTIYPDGTFLGPMVTLLNENSSSDGDIFPAMFREAGLGPLIGKRSWGGVVGITNHGQLIDGGTVNVPEFGFANLNGQWIIEGHGVDPDIDVDNDAPSVIAGKDPQLERGVAELMKKIKEKPTELPRRPADPVKLK
jgi:tricorn protease